MRTHYGMKESALCKAPMLLVKSCTLDINAVDCPGCLWQTLGSLMHQADVCANRLREVTNGLINAAEYRIGTDKV